MIPFRSNGTTSAHSRFALKASATRCWHLNWYALYGATQPLAPRTSNCYYSIIFKHQRHLKCFVIYKYSVLNYGGRWFNKLAIMAAVKNNFFFIKKLACFFIIFYCGVDKFQNMKVTQFLEHYRLFYKVLNI